MGSANDIFFQIILFFAGAIIGVIVPQVKKKTQKQFASVLAFCLIISSVAWTSYEFGLNQVKVTNTAQAEQLIIPSPTRNPIALEPTWLDEGKSLLTLSNQVVIRITYLSHYSNSSLSSIDLEITVSNIAENHTSLDVGERTFFTYKSVEYSVTVLEIDSYRARISVEEKLSQEE